MRRLQAGLSSIMMPSITAVCWWRISRGVDSATGSIVSRYTTLTWVFCQSGRRIGQEGPLWPHLGQASWPAGGPG